jgi:hypothetical protein
LNETEGVLGRIGESWLNIGCFTPETGTGLIICAYNLVPVVIYILLFVFFFKRLAEF